LRAVQIRAAATVLPQAFRAREDSALLDLDEFAAVISRR
jgi:hypothetical protein